MKQLIWIAAVVLMLSGFTLHRLDGFTERKIHGPLAEGTAAPLSQPLWAALAQPYSYFAKGRQCFVFVSEDRRTVIKFLNYNRFSTFWFKQWFQEYADKRKHRLQETLNSFLIASQYLQKETGLLYAHLQEGGALPYLTLVDRGGRKHRIDLNQTVFLLQKCARSIYEELESVMEIKGEEGLKDRIEAFLSVIQRRCEEGIADDDRDVELNFGFIEGEPILMDPGRLFFSDALHTKQGMEREVRIATKRLRKWLLKTHPETIVWLDRRVREITDALSEEKR